jgi:acyl carrier protein
MPFPDAIDDDDELDIFGLDSLAFMELLTAIEAALGFIPQAILEGDLYPETFGELVSAYDPKQQR